MPGGAAGGRAPGPYPDPESESGFRGTGITEGSPPRTRVPRAARARGAGRGRVPSRRGRSEGSSSRGSKRRTSRG